MVPSSCRSGQGSLESDTMAMESEFMESSAYSDNNSTLMSAQGCCPVQFLTHRVSCCRGCCRGKAPRIYRSFIMGHSFSFFFFLFLRLYMYISVSLTHWVRTIDCIFSWIPAPALYTVHIDSVLIARRKQYIDAQYQNHFNRLLRLFLIYDFVLLNVAGWTREC